MLGCILYINTPYLLRDCFTVCVRVRAYVLPCKTHCKIFIPDLYLNMYSAFFCMSGAKIYHTNSKIVKVHKKITVKITEIGNTKLHVRMILNAISDAKYTNFHRYSYVCEVYITGH